MENSPKDESANGSETTILKLGYFAMLAERHPFNKEASHCLTPESAYLLFLERKYTEIPQDLTYEKLERNIPEVHKERIFAVWEKVGSLRKVLENATDVLLLKWENAPNVSRDAMTEDMGEITAHIRGKLKRAAAATTIALPHRKPGEKLSDLRAWQLEEKALRNGFYEADKNYLVALRLYYEMLLESDPDLKKGSTLDLPFEHSLRFKIVVHNRYLRMIDATHQGISLAKATHHEQHKKRVRSRRMVPYIFHPLEVAEAAVVDVAPHVVEQKKMSLSQVVLVLIAALHDVWEDTDLALEDIVRDFLKPRIDKIDSKLDPIIRGGFGLTRAQIKEKMLDLVRGEVLDELKFLLRILSSNNDLNDFEKRRALAQNIAGPENIMRILQVRETQYAGWGVDKRLLAPPLKTFSHFPDAEADATLESFLVRLNVLTISESGTSRTRRQIALITKIEDRAHNLGDIWQFEPDKRRKNLRATVAYLIAYAMLDYDQEHYPLYNALPRLIDVTAREYEKFLRDCPDAAEEKDRRYFEQLKQWQEQVRRFPVPQDVSASTEAYESGVISEGDDKRSLLSRVYGRLRGGG